VLLTNHLGFGSTTISAIYKDRWQIEIFFKALKQNLKIKMFVGTSENALKIQIWAALIAILLLKFLLFRFRITGINDYLKFELFWTAMLRTLLLAAPKKQLMDTVGCVLLPISMRGIGEGEASMNQVQRGGRLIGRPFGQSQAVTPYESLVVSLYQFQ